MWASLLEVCSIFEIHIIERHLKKIIGLQIICLCCLSLFKRIFCADRLQLLTYLERAVVFSSSLFSDCLQHNVEILWWITLLYCYISKCLWRICPSIILLLIPDKYNEPKCCAVYFSLFFLSLCVLSQINYILLSLY